MKTKIVLAASILVLGAGGAARAGGLPYQLVLGGLALQDAGGQSFGRPCAEVALENLAESVFDEQAECGRIGGLPTLAPIVLALPTGTSCLATRLFVCGFDLLSR